MGYKYLHVNTKHLPTTKTSSYRINLQEPIKHATHVEVVAFSTQNDFYNVHEKNNRFQFLFRGPNLDTSLTITENAHAIYDMNFSINPDFYTHEDMVDAINNSMQESVYAIPGQTDFELGVVLRPDLTTNGLQQANDFPPGSPVKTVRILFSINAGKTIVKIDHEDGAGTDLINYGFMSYFEYEVFEFESSIYRRLGFTRDQIFFTDSYYGQNSELLEQVNTNGDPQSLVKFNTKYDVISHEGGKSGGKFDPSDKYVSVSSVSTDGEKYRTFEKCFALASLTRNFAYSKGLAWETHEALHLYSDLVSDFETTSHNYKNIGRSEQTNLLVRIPVDVNRASWIHYISREQEAVHSLNKSYFSSFNISLTSTHSKTHFTSDAYQSFAFTLKFTTKDEEVEPNIRQYESSERGQVRTQYERV
tara:strand:+ start:130 stop:1383 length:1254 start_codon:yes stop_codon:yes gene_type:complete